MQLSRFIVVMAAAAVASASGSCTSENGKPLPDSVRRDVLKISAAMTQVTLSMMMDIMGGSSSLGKRQLFDITCKENETCVVYEGIPSCYDEETTALRSAPDTTIVLKTGDIIFPDQTKANVFNNVQPIKDLVMREAENMMKNLSEEDLEKLLYGDMSPLMGLQAGGAASAASSTASVPASATAPAKATEPAGTLAKSSSASAAAPKQSAAGDNEDSSAGRKVVGGSLLAAAAALAAVIVA